MLQLNDREIRTSLITKLKNQSIKPKAIIEELRIHNGNAIADVVSLHNEAHCYEIKGVGDKIERILIQGKYYNLAFRKITLVTTIKHLEKALNIAPKFWGIMLAEENNTQVKIKYVRRAKNNPNFDKRVALLTLWKDEMISLIKIENKNTSKYNRNTLAKLIADDKKKIELSQNISYTLYERQKLNKYSQTS